MRACWLKWVGRDWSISAGYIWLNYSDANINDADFCLRVWEAGYRTIFTPYAELYHYEFTSRGREEANEEKLRRWKREQALFMQRLPEFFLTGNPWLGPNLTSESEYFSL